MAEILHFPSKARRKDGRRRLHPAPNVPMGDILDFPGAHPTAEQQIADYEACISQIASGLLMAVEAVRVLKRMHPSG